jgi:hypothetical protein
MAAPRNGTQAFSLRRAARRTRRAARRIMVISSSENDEMTLEFTVAPDSAQEWKLASG